uniref:CNNM transmembrane domain-containing protein n=1 Tax=Onchocerca volvulus TaxID=6282 RepID=A0A8R1TZN2_ONCVO
MHKQPDNSCDYSLIPIRYEPSRINNDNSSINATINPILYGMRIERRLDDEYFNFVTRLDRNQKNQRVIVFGDHLSAVKRLWFSVDFICASEKIAHSAYLDVQIEQRIDDHMLQCIVDTSGSNMTRPMQLCVEPLQLMPDPTVANIEFTQAILEETETHLFPFYIELMIIAICAMLSAIFSGLTTGLMALSTDDLKLIAKGSDDKKEREYASNILPLRARGNFLLCSIVLGNTICNIMVTLLISDIFKSVDEYYVNIVLSLVTPTIIITLLGEIVPQAVCARHALCIGSRTRYLTIFFMVLSAPISYPFSLILDLLLGKEGRDVYDRKTIRAMITMQRNLTKEKLSKQMDSEATDLVLAAFDLPEKIVKSVMTPIDKIFMLSDQNVISKQLLKTIAAKGRTRIPIYSGNDRNTIIAILNMKDLLPFCQTKFIKVGTVVQVWKRSSQFRFIIDNMPVLQLLIEMRTGIHIAMVFTYDEQKRDYIVQGLVTIEDLVEEVVGEIFDEQDVKIRRAGLTNRYWRRMHTNI